MMEDKEQKLIGELLARGLADQQVIEELIAADYAQEEAVTLLRTFFDEWQSMGVAANSDDDVKLLNWHIMQRHNLLTTAITSNQLSTALAILESLAKLQGLAQVTEAKVIPIKIELIEKKEDDASNNSSGSSG